MRNLTRFDPEITRLEHLPVPTNAVILYGSSTFTIWGQKEATKQLAPHSIHNLGFGGSTAEEALNYFDRLITPNPYKILVLYEGDNDLAMEYKPKEIIGFIEKMVQKSQQKNPQAKILLLGIKDSPAREHLMAQRNELNHLLSQLAVRYSKVFYLDLSFVTHETASSRRPGVYEPDNLHFNSLGYQFLGTLLKTWLDEYNK